MTVKEEVIHIAKNAQAAFRANLGLSAKVKNQVLKAMSGALLAKKRSIIAANKKDLRALI